MQCLVENSLVVEVEEVVVQRKHDMEVLQYEINVISLKFVCSSFNRTNCNMYKVSLQLVLKKGAVTSVEGT